MISVDCTVFDALADFFFFFFVGGEEIKIHFQLFSAVCFVGLLGVIIVILGRCKSFFRVSNESCVRNVSRH